MLSSLDRTVVGLLIAMGSLLGLSGPTAAASDGFEETVRRATALLPRRPEKIVIVDVEHATLLLQETLKHAEGFVTHGERVVYLIKQGDTLQHALKGRGIFDYALAAVIWHEMAHIDGADERGAQQKEEELWKQFLLENRVETVRGLRYLALLEKRH